MLSVHRSQIQNHRHVYIQSPRDLPFGNFYDNIGAQVTHKCILALIEVMFKVKRDYKSLETKKEKVEAATAETEDKKVTCKTVSTLSEICEPVKERKGSCKDKECALKHPAMCDV